MDLRNKVWPILRLSLAGVLIGYLLGFAWEHYLKDNKAYLFATVGGLIGLLSLPVYRWGVSGGKQIEIDSVEVELPFVGTTLAFKISDANRIVGWKLFVESATRITTQSLDSDAGILREALTSMYRLFDIVRGELKSMKPSPASSDQSVYTVECYALLMLNDGLRQTLSRWHPRLLKWEKTALPESEWPLNEYCRADIESARQIILAYTWGLGEIVKVPDLARLLPLRPEGPKPELTPIANIQAREKDFECDVSVAEREAGWRILIELNSRIVSEPLARQAGLLREALSSLYALFEIVRTELKKIPPAPPCLTSVAVSNGQGVAGIALSILNDDIRPFLAQWHPALLKWEKQNTGTSETDWPEANSCRQALENLRVAVALKAKALARTICIPAGNGLNH